MPSSICMIVTPVTSSPFRTAYCIGDAPLYFGKSDAWILTQPYFGISRISFDKICPKAATTKISAPYVLSSSTASGALILAGCKTVSPCARAHSLTGENCTFRSRPFCLSGCVTTAKTSCPASISASSAPTAKSGVPIKIIFIPIRSFSRNARRPSILRLSSEC